MKFFPQFGSGRAFTLIELLIVIAIIGILSGMAVVSMSGATESARVAKLKVFSNSIRNSLLMSRVSEWKFDEGSGTTAADTAGVNTCTLYNFDFSGNSNWATSSCVSGSCLSLDGVDDAIGCGNDSSLNTASVSVEMWLYLSSDPDCDAGNNWRSVIRKGTTAGAATGYDVVLEEGRGFAWDIGTGASSRWWPSNINISVGQWTHYVFTYDADSGNMGAYKNGKVSSDTPHTITPAAIASNANILAISNISVACPNGSGAFPGLVDEVRIYSAAMTASEAKENYLAGLNKLLAKGYIAQKDHQQRLLELETAYGTRK